MFLGTDKRLAMARRENRTQNYFFGSFVSLGICVFIYMPVAFLWRST